MIKSEEFIDIFRLKETGYSISGKSRVTGNEDAVIDLLLSNTFKRGELIEKGLNFFKI